MHTQKHKTQENLQNALAREQHSVHHASEHRTPYDHAVFKWQAPEYIQHPKSRAWYITAAIVIAALLVYDVVSQNYTMALAVIVFAAVYQYIHVHHPPKMLNVTLSHMGVKIGSKVIPYSDISAFWIYYNPPHVKTLNFHVRKNLLNEISIELNDEDPAAIRTFLCNQIPELEGKKEELSQIILRLLKL